MIVSGNGRYLSRTAHDHESAFPAAVGGGGAPGVELESAAVNLPESLAVPLRRGEPAVVGRLEQGRLLLDLRSVAPADDERLVDAVTAAGGRALP